MTRPDGTAPARPARHILAPRDLPDGPVCRLGLATRGGAGLSADDVRYALHRGVNFLNWCGQPDGLSRAVRLLGPGRGRVMVCAQFEARSERDARGELDALLAELGTDYIDVLTFYYVEEPAEWEEITGAGGALAYCREACRQGRVRLLGLTTHQRPLAAAVARQGLLDVLMIRYNAAHRGAESEVFPAAQAAGMPVIVYTCLRWGALLRGTPADPPGFVPPAASAWYRFALQHPGVAVALAAPDSRAELDETLTVLDTPGTLPADEYAALAAHGARVRAHAGHFP